VEARSIEQLAFEGCEEALRHGVVVGVAHAAHRGTDAECLAAVAEGDRGVLAALVAGMDHVLRSPRLSRFGELESKPEVCSEQ
jgi:hypothetical protein